MRIQRGFLLLLSAVLFLPPETCGQGCTDGAIWCKDALPFCRSNSYIRNVCKAKCSNCGTGNVATFGPWSNWGACSKKCDGGMQDRKRTCSVPGQCIGPTSASRPCNQQPCIINQGCTDSERWCAGNALWCSVNRYVRDRCKKTCRECSSSSTGEWGSWEGWKACSKECGGGEQTRSRTCSIEGKCDGSSSESQPCNIQPCIVKGEWGSWEGWKACSKECGGGEQTRSRTCSIEGKCDGSSSESQSCNIQPCVVTGCTDSEIWCAGNGRWCSVNQYIQSRCKKTCGKCSSSSTEYTNWTSYGVCSLPCGGGVHSRTRVCNSGSCDKHVAEVKNCNMAKCSAPDCVDTLSDCVARKEWNLCPRDQEYCRKTCDFCGGGEGGGSGAEWSAYGPCSVPCGVGWKTRSKGLTQQRITCIQKECGETGTWSEWSQYGPCSVNCGEGTELRTRTCSNPGTCIGKDEESRICERAPCQGTWGAWSFWSQCTKTCGGGQQDRDRACEGTGECIGSANDQRKCNEQACPEYSQWTTYGQCSDNCGGGVQSRTRLCNHGACVKHLEEIRNCNEQQCSVPGPQWSAYGPCSVHCGVGIKTRTKGSISQSITCIITGCDPNAPYWSQWTAFSACSETCGVGSQKRTRTCSKPGACPGFAEESKTCTIKLCQGVWNQWTVWGACSEVCDGGDQERTRTCQGPGTCTGEGKQTQKCNTQPCIGVWNPWGVWGACSEECDGGDRERTRTCKGPGTCPGEGKQTQQCNTQPCVGVWNPWTVWGACSAECDGGDQERTRTCKGPGTCPGEGKQTQRCNTQPCVGSWGSWTMWSDCKPDCGDGSQERSRPCNGPGNCDGESSQTRFCSNKKCDDGWLPWENWGGCSEQCGAGVETRLRVCTRSTGCSGNKEDTRPCFLRACVDESTFSPCSMTCGDGIQKKMNITSKQYITKHCNEKQCPLELCKSDEERKYTAWHSCCKKTDASYPECQWPALTSARTLRRIIGGQNTQRGDLGWMMFYSGSFGVCGGALISSKFVITAAHCIQLDSGYKYDVTTFTAILGYSDLNRWDRTNYALSRGIVHPDYAFPKHDIAILELKNEVKSTAYIRPVCLPHGEVPLADSTCIAAGWGVSQNGVRQATTILQNVDLNVFDTSVCVNGYWNDPNLKSFLPFLKSNRGYICAGDYKEEKDSCSGDSGSPLVCQRCDSCSYYIAGVVSYGPQPCATIGVPGIYTKVSEYEEWIYHVTGIPKETLACSGNR